MMMEPELEPHDEREVESEHPGLSRVEQALDRVDALVSAHPHVAAVCAAAVGGMVGYLWPRKDSEVAIDTERKHGRTRAMAGTAARRAGSMAMAAAIRAGARRLMSSAAETLH